jgi:hypothetical protein
MHQPGRLLDYQAQPMREAGGEAGINDPVRGNRMGARS